MTAEQIQLVPTELSEKLCQIVNEVLATFNQKNVTPSEAGTIVLALIHRLMGVLHDNPEVQRAFVTSIIGVVNEHLLGILDSGEPPVCQS
jgi:hypothetical protein